MCHILNTYFSLVSLEENIKQGMCSGRDCVWTCNRAVINHLVSLKDITLIYLPLFKSNYSKNNLLCTVFYKSMSLNHAF